MFVSVVCVAMTLWRSLLLVGLQIATNDGSGRSAEEGGHEDAGVQVEGCVPPAVREVEHLEERRFTFRVVRFCSKLIRGIARAR